MFSAQSLSCWELQGSQVLSVGAVSSTTLIQARGFFHHALWDSREVGKGSWDSEGNWGIPTFVEQSHAGASLGLAQCQHLHHYLC